MNETPKTSIKPDNSADQKGQLIKILCRIPVIEAGIKLYKDLTIRNFRMSRGIIVP